MLVIATHPSSQSCDTANNTGVAKSWLGFQCVALVAGSRSPALLKDRCAESAMSSSCAACSPCALQGIAELLRLLRVEAAVLEPDTVKLDDRAEARLCALANCLADLQNQDAILELWCCTWLCDK